MGKPKLILFGAGRNGILALEKYGTERVAFFCDNAVEKQGKRINGILVLTFEEMIKRYQKGAIIMVTPAYHALLIGQLEREGVFDYLVFHNEETRFPLKEEEDAEERNRILNMLVKKCSPMDLLADCSEFAKLSEEALRLHKEENILLAHPGINSEGKYYGNLQSILNYGGISQEEEKYFPIVSHYDSMPLYAPAFHYKTAVIMSGEYFKRKIHERVPYVPVFSIGPYIHYAKGIYSEEKIQEIKEKNGKTLLIFSPHSIESTKRKYDKKLFIDNVVKEYGSQFSSMWLCTYWTDLNDPVCQYAESIGIHVVTAGFRFDSKFSQRLKTVFEIADAIVCGDIGTFIPYALFLGKPVGRLDISNSSTNLEDQIHFDWEKEIQMTEDYLRFQRDFHLLFDKELRNNKSQRDWMNEVGGFSQIRDKDYLHTIYEISKDIWMTCDGDLEKYPEAVREVYSLYDKNFEFDKMSILKEAVGAYLY